MIAVAASAVLLGVFELKRRSTQFSALSSFHTTEAVEYARYAEHFKAAQSDDAPEMWISFRKTDSHLRRFWERAAPGAKSTPEEVKGTGMLVIRPGQSDAALAGSLVRYHKVLARKYLRAARYPWLPVAPDPPEPK
jgi:hypothetical protein